jgi:GT2 family glycosyltransferase
MTGPYFSVIVPTIHRHRLLVKCIDGVLTGDFADFELLVVDQSSDDLSRLAIAESFGQDPRLRYLHSDVTGAARARNLGSEHACGTILAFLDDDAIPEPGWLSSFARAFREITPCPGMVGGRVTPAWEGPRPAWLPDELMPMLGAYDAGDQPRAFPAGDFPMSGNFALPRALMQQMGGFDTRLGFDEGRSNPLLGGEDSHLGLKVANAGLPVLYHPGAEIRHLIRGSKLTPRYLIRRLYWHGRTYVQLRHRSDGDRRGWMHVLRDSRAKRLARPAPHGRTGPSLQSRAMFAGAAIAFVAGALVETLVLAAGRED